MTKEKKKQASVVQGNDAVIRVNMFLPDMTPIEHVIRIKNLKGRATHSQREAKNVIGAIISGLTKKYGKIG